MCLLAILFLIAQLASVLCGIDRRTLEGFYGKDITIFDSLNAKKSNEALENICKSMAFKIFKEKSVYPSETVMLKMFTYTNILLLRKYEFVEQVVDLHNLTGNYVREYAKGIIAAAENAWYCDPENEYLSSVYFLVGKGNHSSGRYSYNREDLEGMLQSNGYTLLPTKNSGIIGVRLNNSKPNAKVFHNNHVAWNIWYSDVKQTEEKCFSDTASNLQEKGNNDDQTTDFKYLIEDDEELIEKSKESTDEEKSTKPDHLIIDIREETINSSQLIDDSEWITVGPKGNSRSVSNQTERRNRIVDNRLDKVSDNFPRK